MIVTRTVGSNTSEKNWQCSWTKYMWHMDSYDTLTPSGNGINRCKDGFSRNIIWIQANTSNSDLKVITSYFNSTVSELVGCPKIVRSDCGTENVHVNRLKDSLCEADSGTVHGPDLPQGCCTDSQRSKAGGDLQKTEPKRMEGCFTGFPSIRRV